MDRQANPRNRARVFNGVHQAGALIGILRTFKCAVIHQTIFRHRQLCIITKNGVMGRITLLPTYHPIHKTADKHDNVMICDILVSYDKTTIRLVT